MIVLKQTDLYGLGRKSATDERDKNFLMKSILPAQPVRRYRYWNANGYWGDQGATSECVGYGFAHWIEDGPVTHPGVAPIVRPTEIYHAAQKVDEWQGENYDGTSVRAGAKVLSGLGLISGYYWAFDLQTVLDALLGKGPVVIGINWYESMFYPDSKGRMHIAGDIAGGHCGLLNGATLDDREVRFKNSWSRAWGNKGHATLSFDDLERLIYEQGEALIAVEVKKK